VVLYNMSVAGVRVVVEFGTKSYPYLLVSKPATANELT